MKSGASHLCWQPCPPLSTEPPAQLSTWLHVLGPAQPWLWTVASCFPCCCPGLLLATSPSRSAGRRSAAAVHQSLPPTSQLCLAGGPQADSPYLLFKLTRLGEQFAPQGSSLAGRLHPMRQSSHPASLLNPGGNSDDLECVPRTWGLPFTTHTPVCFGGPLEGPVCTHGFVPLRAHHTSAAVPDRALSLPAWPGPDQRKAWWPAASRPALQNE